MQKNEVVKNYEEYVVGSYTRSGLVFVKGKGSYLWDMDGKKYLDFFPGWGVSGLGHCHPTVIRAVKEQAEQLIHIANNHYHPWQGTLAKRLSELSFGGKVFFCNSGAEANEAAIKLARLYGKKTGRYGIISMENSFHGRTLATVTMTGQLKYSKPFEPLPTGFTHVRFNDFDSLKKAVDARTVAVIIEPVQGEGGINVADREYLEKVKDLCNKNDLLLIFDEVQTGFGRTGTLFAYQYFNISPNIMTLAKALGGGFPVGAMVADKELADLMVPGTHASTFGGSPIVCAACLAVLDAIEKEKLLDNVKKQGTYLRNKLTAFKEKYPSVKKIKGLGVMLAMEMDREGTGLVNICARNGLLINCTHTSIMRIMPSIAVTRQEIDEGIAILDASIAEFTG